VATRLQEAIFMGARITRDCAVLILLRKAVQYTMLLCILVMAKGCHSRRVKKDTFHWLREYECMHAHCTTRRERNALTPIGISFEKEK
jgi:hypothetical protein